jgi:glycosyltransferase involved in cell wall biosynthesis
MNSTAEPDAAGAKGATILNVLHLPGLAGTELMYLHYTHMLADAGYQVICLVPPNAQVTPELHDRGYRVIEDAGIHLNKGKFNPLQTQKYRKLLRRQGINLVMTHSGGLTRLFRRACDKHCPLVTVNHNTNPKYTAKADYAIATNRHIWQQVMAHGMDKTRVKLLFNSVDIEGECSPSQPFRSPPVIGWLGRLDANKRVDTLLQALALLRKNGIAFSAIIGGDGPSRNELERLAQQLELTEQVHFDGWVSDKAQFFSRIDVLTFCSMCEGFPLVILEANQYGRAVVSSDFDGVDDLVRHEQTGLIFPRGDARALAERLSALLNDKKMAAQLAGAAFIRTRDHFSKRAIERELDAFIREVLP